MEQMSFLCLLTLPRNKVKFDILELILLCPGRGGLSINMSCTTIQNPHLLAGKWSVMKVGYLQELYFSSTDVKSLLASFKILRYSMLSNMANARVRSWVLSSAVIYCYTFSLMLASQPVLTPQKVAEEFPSVVFSGPLGIVSPWPGQPGPVGDQVQTVAVGTAKSVSVSPVPATSQGAFLPAWAALGSVGLERKIIDTVWQIMKFLRQTKVSSFQGKDINWNLSVFLKHAGVCFNKGRFLIEKDLASNTLILVTLLPSLVLVPDPIQSQYESLHNTGSNQYMP